MIHAHIETREPGKDWHYEHRLDVPNCPAFFDAIGGGEPESKTCRYRARGILGHTSCIYPAPFLSAHRYSWLTIDEWLFAADVLGMVDEFQTLWGLRHIAAKYGVEARIVFWFDKEAAQ